MTQTTTQTTKNVLIATGIFPPDIGGPASYVPKIAQELTSQGHHVTVITYADTHLQSKQFPYRVVSILRGTSRVTRYLKFFFRILRLGKTADLIFAQCPFASGLPTILANIVLHKKIVIKVVGDVAWEIALNKKLTDDSLDTFCLKKYGFSYITFLKSLESTVLKRFSRIIVPSHYLKNIVSSYVDTQHAENIFVVYNSFDKIPFKHIQQAEAKKNKGLERKKVILSVARLVPWKNIDKLIQAISLLENSIILMIAGDGPEEQKFRELAVKLRLQDRVLFLGRISKAELYEMYQLADAFVLISEYEGQSHTLLEAMYMGLPVLVSNRGGNPETVAGYPHAMVAREYLDSEKLSMQLRQLLRVGRAPQNNSFVYEKYGYERMLRETCGVLLR